MRTEIEIIRVDEENWKAEIIGLRNNKVIVDNFGRGKVEEWDLEDLKQCVKFL